MDYSAKSLKIKSDEKIKSLKEKSALDKKSKAAFRDLVKANKSKLYKAALELKRSTQLSISPFENSKWWDNDEFTQFLLDGGFDIIDFDSSHFGSWFGPIHSLTSRELELLESYLEKNLDEIKDQRKALQNSEVKEIINSYRKSSVRTINVLRLLVCFHKLYILFLYKNDVSSFLQEIYNQLIDITEYVSTYIPDIFKTIDPDIVDKNELFTISWRYPSKPTSNNLSFTAETLNWLSSKDGNEAFHVLYKAIEETADSGNFVFETKVTFDSDGFISFIENNISCFDTQLTSISFKDLFETLGYKVEVTKKTSDILKISWN